MILNEQSTSSTEISCLLWNDRQVSKAIGMPFKRVQELARKGLLPGFKIGKHWRFDPDKVRSWVKSNGKSKEAE
jgi:hypothetical protein